METCYKKHIIDISWTAEAGSPLKQTGRIGRIITWDYPLGDISDRYSFPIETDFMTFALTNEILKVPFKVIELPFSRYGLEFHPFKQTDWDGWIFTDLKYIRERFKWKHITSNRSTSVYGMLKQELGDYSAFLSGDTYKATIKYQGKVVTEMGDYYGSLPELNNFILLEARKLIDNMITARGDQLNLDL